MSGAKRKHFLKDTPGAWCVSRLSVCRCKTENRLQQGDLWCLLLSLLTVPPEIPMGISVCPLKYVNPVC